MDSDSGTASQVCPTPPSLVTLPEIEAAAVGLRGVIVPTPLLPAPWAPRLLLKPESLQPTGAFKLRGAHHALSVLSPAEREAGVVTHSSGNHGQALAYAAARYGVPGVVVMPADAVPHKIEACRRWGAEVVLVPPAERLRHATRLAAERGMRLVPSYDDHHVITGQGTVGLEIGRELPDLAAVVVPVGGGGLAAGVATAVKALHPGARVIGVEPAEAADARASLAAGALRPWPVARAHRTVADGLRTQLSERTLAHLRAHLDEIVTVTDAQILATGRELLQDARLVVEPSGAVAPAAVRHGAVTLPRRGTTVAVISGGNAAPGLIEEFARPPGRPTTAAG